MNLKVSRMIYIFAGIYDIILGLIALFLIEDLSELIGIAIPTPLIISQTLGLFLIAMGYLLIYASTDIVQYAFIGIISAFVRISYVILLLISAIYETIELVYIFIGLGDGITGFLLFLAVWKNYKGINLLILNN